MNRLENNPPQTSPKPSSLRRFCRRGPWEILAILLILLGVFMLVQPFSLWVFGKSLSVILVGTIGYMIVSHFPE